MHPVLLSSFSASCITAPVLIIKKKSYIGLSEHTNIQMEGMRKTTDAYDVTAGLHAGIW